MAFTNVYEFGTVFYSRAVALFSPAFCAIAGVSTEVSYCMALKDVVTKVADHGLSIFFRWAVYSFNTPICLLLHAFAHVIVHPYLAISISFITAVQFI
jgi:hypothetical protein